MYKKIIILLFFVCGNFSIVVAQDTALKIIQKSVVSKKNNYPRNYQYTSYNKLIITANPDFVEGNIDSIFITKRGRKIFKEVDSSDCEFKKIISKQHLYQTEKISVITKENNAVKEEIISTKMAGFKEPIYEYFSLQLQPFSVYDNRYTLVEKEYWSPISTRGIRIYSYSIQDTFKLENRTVFKIAFQPKKATKTDRLEGYIYIDSEKFSVVKMEISMRGKINASAIYEFDFNEKINNWFPKKMKLFVKKGNSKYPIKLLGETITFDGTDAKLNPLNRKYASDFLELQSETTCQQLSFDIMQKIKQKYIAVEVSEKAIKRKENQWFEQFTDTIDKRSNPTYVSLDSLIEKRRIENIIRIGRKVIKGYYPIGFFDFDLRYLARYNNHEGFRFGVGGVTNEKFSRKFKIEGFAAYGTKDGSFKGHISNAFRVNNPTETWIGVSYKDDVLEIANTSFEIDKKIFKLYDPRPLNLTTFYNHETWKAFLETKAIPKTESSVQFSQSHIIPKFDYFYQLDGQAYHDFKITSIVTSVQWNPFSKYMQTPNGRLETDKGYPKFTFQYFSTIPNTLENTYSFGKIDFRFDYQKKFNSTHKIGFLLESGYAYGNTPLTHLYNHTPNSLHKDKILQRITFASKDSFETMFFNEFFSDKYVYAHLKHQFPKWQLSRQIKPILSLVTRYGLGELQNKENHIGIDFKTLEKGYHESGFELNQIYNGIGFTAFYRHGANHLPDFEDNIAVKLSIQINLGFNN